MPTVGIERHDLAWVRADALAALGDGPPAYLLGLRDGAAYFAVDVSVLDDPVESLAMEAARFADARGLATRLGAEEAGIVAHAKALVDWHARHGFCPSCGERTHPRDGGNMRKCAACNAEHFPRTDPVVIMVVWKGDRCLLGRQRTFAPGMYSALAGFVDQGETIEEAVRREVKEEVGLEVDEVRYYASQPWPFPMSLMIGCFAHVGRDEFRVDAFELDGARWFTREEAHRAVMAPDPALGFSVPGRLAIAHHLIKAWAEGR